jgi:hypothetical protein
MDPTAIREEINRLVANGTRLRERELIAQAPQDQRAKIINLITQDPDREILLKAPNFGNEYQTWYSPALPVVEQLLPDRYDEFRNLYKNERRKRLDAETFGIGDYISGIRPYNIGNETALSIAITCFNQQIAIVSTAEERLESVLTDIGRTLHAEILDDELAEARKLLANEYIRPAGVVAGVALEGHLKKLIAEHKISFRRTAVLSNLNGALKDAGVYDVPQWRRIQYLTDVRNLCGHKSEREPKREEVEDLINEAAKIIKTIY